MNAIQSNFQKAEKAFTATVIFYYRNKGLVWGLGTALAETIGIAALDTTWWVRIPLLVGVAATGLATRDVVDEHGPIGVSGGIVLGAVVTGLCLAGSATKKEFKDPSSTFRIDDKLANACWVPNQMATVTVNGKDYVITAKKIETTQTSESADGFSYTKNPETHHGIFEVTFPYKGFWDGKLHTRTETLSTNERPGPYTADNDGKRCSPLADGPG